MAKLFKQAGYGLCSTVDRSGTTVSTSSYSYYGINSKAEYKKYNSAVVAFDTSNLPKQSALKYKKDIFAFFSVKLVQGYSVENSVVKKESIVETDIVIRKSYKAANQVVAYNYDDLKANCPKVRSDNAVLSGTRENPIAVSDLTDNKTIILQFNESDGDLGKISATGCYLTLYYNDAVQTITDDKSESSFIHTNGYTLKWKYDSETGSPMTAYAIRWVASNGQSGAVAKTAKSLASGSSAYHTFPANVFPFSRDGITISFYVTTYEYDGTPSNETLVKNVISYAATPTVTPTYPIDGEEFYKAEECIFKWNYSDLGELTQQEYSITYKNDGVTNTVSAKSANLYHRFAPNTFKPGIIEYSITVTSRDGTTTTAGPFTANAVLSVPKISASSPIDEAEFSKSQDVIFKWNYSDPADVKQKSVLINWEQNGNTHQKTVNGSDNYYKFLGGTFEEGEVKYYLTATNEDGSKSSKEGPYKAIATSSIPTVNITYPTDGLSVNYSQSFGITWDFSETVATGQKFYQIDIKRGSNVVKTYTGTTGNNQTVISKDLGEGEFDIVLTVKNGDGKTATSTASFVVVKAIPVIAMTYPVGIIVKRNSETIFLWNYSDVPIDVGQVSYTIKYKQDGNDWTEVSETSSNHYHTFPANTFENGRYRYSLSVTNADGVVTETEVFSFTVVGETEAPTVTNVTNNAKPVISWDIESQTAYEIEISKDKKVILETGLISSDTDRNYKIDKLLENGRYSLKIRAVNEFGYYTEYTNYTFVLNAENDDELGEIYVTVNRDYSITVNYNVVKNEDAEIYVARQDSKGNIAILGEYFDGFIDYTAELNRQYKYAIIDYNVGIKYSDFRSIILNLDGVVIRSSSEKEKYVHIYKSDSELFEIKKGNERTKTMYQCLGRKNPVKEVGEWINITRSFEAYVTEDEYELLVDMQLNSNSVLYQADREFMICDMDLTNTGQYIGSGRFIAVALTKIEG